MITHLDSTDIDSLIKGYREKANLFNKTQLGWLINIEKIDTLQRLRKSLYDEYFEPIFYYDPIKRFDQICDSLRSEESRIG